MQDIPVAAINAVGWTFTGIAILLTFGRYHLHWQKNKRFGFDDHFNGLALLFLLGTMITYQLAIPTHLALKAHHSPSNHEIDFYLKVNAANGALFFCTLYAVKASFLALYWNLFEVSTRFRVIWGLSCVVTAASLLAILLSVFWQCGRPRDAFKKEHCETADPQLIRNATLLYCVLNVAGDFILMAIPLVMLRHLHIPTHKRLGLALLFSLVLVTIACDIIRTVFTLMHNSNALWALLEATITVIVCALPCYGGVLSRMPRRIFGSIGDVRSASSPRTVRLSEGGFSHVLPGLKSSKSSQSEEC